VELGDPLFAAALKHGLATLAELFDGGASGQWKRSKFVSVQGKPRTGMVPNRAAGAQSEPSRCLWRAPWPQDPSVRATPCYPRTVGWAAPRVV
jgi:hypothetical protein